ncbi:MULTISPECIES: hypothetical protein [Streptomyces]|uniref:Uncharacterized protein n=1 Tax=Streptomyces morookaense TaxID=1970 RepID=A0A7Y7E6W8_STRMO|nr:MULTISPECIES: hypothetical protein [Streptomyces]MCC2278269.1 hypothetical protein [Streptomyces sp. ET3-23]NVK77791.1 hypothetical protein [Streptomyces morookaense]GHF19947.1 hypothetical protein GCM10010359_21480 [Streptomyces morookaense]
MDDLLHKLVSGAITGGLIALVGGLSMASRRRRAAREQAAAARSADAGPDAGRQSR